MRRLILLLACLVVVAAEPATARGAVRVTQGIVYGDGRVNQPDRGQARLLLDLYRPETTSRRMRPAVVLVHGGGFRSGSRSQPDLVRIARGLVRGGAVVASIDYRLTPQDPVASRRVARVAAAAPDFPVFSGMVAAVDDTLTALDWLRDHDRAARLGVDRNRIGLVGGSAGAITAGHVAYALNDIAVPAPRIRFVGDLWGGLFLTAPGAGSGAAQLERGEAALFAVHGSGDRTVPVDLDDALVARARSVGVRTEYHRIPGAGHGFGAIGFFTRNVAGDETAYERLLRFARVALR